MASLTIRNLDDHIKERLRIEAAHNGHSMEEEARLILRRALSRTADSQGLGSRIRARFAETGGVELELPERTEPARLVDLGE
ncbi:MULTISPECIES: FitA-like ribbon-helix-helix domain-containing protein [Pseudomonas]|jgi:plasmid stability protein|uniref:Bifunctional SbtC-like/phosphopantothenoylcysteine decarboxylase/phosphopantothenate synthase n=3 Tax=Pseudomonas chlororaphis TaxID=587753 RepID=A0AAQ1FRF3_9PSED|nr:MULTISPECIES: plasmid stabilization protein [Pseudomonas]AIS15597.1 plasmid stabilization protein [Pseudomonas chlororaphis subsp. aurantiaca]AVO56659.1 plasmid stabilization protein [Pseudomonas chlororaphis subsp. piscium]AZC34700.1 putative plasmid stability protein [Pseudomonas chlororaphis subsp. piscium]AZC41238.1 putative plasmid stability protein [Pseudomonas chlororaphis subsp. piscium]AZC47899.1 putative plasmid stability protein [Pseudomonas chlororaphis subsp. piscium]